MKRLRASLFGAIATGAVVFWAMGAAKADVKSGEKALLDALKKSDNQKAVQEACDELIKAGGKDGITPILKILPKLKPDVPTDYYWQLVGGAGGFADKSALEELGAFILANAKISLGKDCLFALQNNPSPYVVVPLGKVLEKGPYDLQLMSVDQLSSVRSVDAIDTLIAGHTRELKGDKELHHRIDVALEVLLGQSIGCESLESWWKENKEKGVPAKKAGAPTGGGNGSGLGTVSRERDELKEADPKGVVVISSNRHMLKSDPSKPVVDPNDYDYDHMQGVLDTLKIPHVVIAKQEFEDDPQVVLKHAYAILVNCANISPHCICPTCKPGGDKSNRMFHCTGCNKHDVHGWCFTDKAIAALKQWTENGGYLFTEDMGVIELINKAWPELVSTKETDAPENKNMVGPDGKPLGNKKPLEVKEATIRLLPGKGQTTHPLMRGVWSRNKTESEKAEEAAKAAGEGGNGTVERKESPAKQLEHKWHVDDQSPAFKVTNPKLVITLFESEELGKMADGETAVAVTFRVGKASTKQATGSRGSGEWAIGGGGRVLHTMSHFGKQDSSQDGQALLNLILNFLVEARKHHDANSPKK